MKHVLAGWLILLCAASVAAPAPALKGTVTEVAAGDGFTYFQVATATERIWVYGPVAEVRLHDAVTIPSDDRKRKVSSKELDHVFRDIYYVADLGAVVDLKARAAHDATAGAAGEPAGAAASVAAQGLPAGHPQVPGMGTAEGQLPAGHPPIPGATQPGGTLPAGHPPIPGAEAQAGLPAGHPPVAGAGAPKAAVASAEPIRVAKAEGGKTIEEVYAQMADLAGKEVLVRGQVVKAKGNIMNRTWIHIQDGTGSEGTNDLTVTTEAEAPAVGGVILVRGVVAVAKDFGYGYTYAVIVENATLTPAP
jgi:hypothetical protein